MEAGLESGLPTYSGGLGVLAGDILRAAADIGLSMVGVTLVHRQGYFRQKIDSHGNQTELPSPWDPASRLERLPATVSVTLRGRAVHVGAWRYQIIGATDRGVSVYMLDTDLPENHPDDRR